jgi:hypothetical protein
MPVSKNVTLPVGALLLTVAVSTSALPTGDGLAPLASTVVVDVVEPA